jgi:hypothetical protein
MNELANPPYLKISSMSKKFARPTTTWYRTLLYPLSA